MLRTFLAAATASEATEAVTSEPVASSAEEMLENTVENVVSFWDSIWKWFSVNWPSFLIAAVILVGGWWIVTLIIKLMKHTMKKAGIEKSAITFVTSVTKYLLRLIVIILALYPFGVQFATIFAALGAAGLGVGLGLKDVIANIASGITIIITKPFSVGHYIAINNVEGTVQKVEIMFTTLKTLESQEVVIPNSTLTAGTVTNYTSLGVRRVQFDFNLQYGSDLSYIRSLLLDLVKQNEMVLDEPTPMFVIIGQAADGIACSLRAWSAPENYWYVFWDVNEAISNAFRDQGIRVPFSQLDVHICNAQGNSGGDPVETANSTQNP